VPLPRVEGPMSRLLRSNGAGPVKVIVLSAANPNHEVGSPGKLPSAASKTAELLSLGVRVKPDSVYGDPGLTLTRPPAGATPSKKSSVAFAEEARRQKEDKRIALAVRSFMKAKNTVNVVRVSIGVIP
jgi:hypothetical protein